jgi:hypothetical protein
MRSQKSFGRRASPQSETRIQPPSAVTTTASAEISTPPAESQNVPARVTPAMDEAVIDVDRELEEWKAARKAHKHSFREPWRSLAMSSAVGFGLSSWLLPDAVANIAELVTGGLGAASFFAGFRLVQPEPQARAKFED